MHLLKSFLIVLAAIDFNIPLISDFEFSVKITVIVLISLYFVTSFKVKVPSHTAIVFCCMVATFIFLLPISENVVFQSRFEDNTTLMLLYIFLVSLYLSLEIDTYHLLIFTLMTLLSVIIFSIYQYLFLPLGVLRPNSFSGSSSVFIMQVILLLNMVIFTQKKLKIPGFIYSSILISGILSGSAKTILLFPYYLKKRRIILLLTTLILTLIIFLQFSRSFENIIISLTERKDFFYNSSVIHSTFDAIVHSKSPFIFISICFLFLVSLFSLLKIKLKYLISLFLILVVLISEHQLFGDNLFTTCCLIANFTLMMQKFYRN